MKNRKEHDLFPPLIMYAPSHLTAFSCTCWVWRVCSECWTHRGSHGSHVQPAWHSPTAVGSRWRSHCSKQWACLPLFLPALFHDSEPPAAGYLQQHDWGQSPCELESNTAASCLKRSFANKDAQFTHGHKHRLVQVKGRINMEDMISGIMN